VTRVIDRDLGWQKIKGRLGDAGKHHLVAGIIGATDQRDGGEFSNVQIGTVHEFGLGVPERSFLRATVDERSTFYRRLVKKLMQRALDMKGTVSEALRILGEQMKADIVRRIDRGIDPPLHPATIAAKGSSKPLIDTGQLKQSITYEVRS
jgi:hypothetical protein